MIGHLLSGSGRGHRRHQRKACVVALGRIGDFVLSLPTIRLFAREFGARELTLVVPPVVVPLAVAELPGVELITLPAEAGGLFREIVPIWWTQRPKFMTHGFERKITLNHYRPFYQEIARSWIHAKADFFLTPETYPREMQDGQCRELQAHRLVASAALGREVALEEIVPGFTRFPASNDGRLLVYPLSQDRTRSVPAERIAVVLRLWRGRSRAPIVLGGSPRDLAELEHYATVCRTAGLDGIAVEAPAGVNSFVTHLAAAGAVLAADSAAAHVGTAFDKPTVVLMAHDWYGLSQPWHKSARQRTFFFDTADPEIAAALPTL